MKNFKKFSSIVILIAISFLLIIGIEYYLSKFPNIFTFNRDVENNYYYDFAIQNKDLESCNKIVESPGQKDSCYWNIARETKNISVCDQIPNLENKEWCYNEMAEVNNDIAICEKITSPEAKIKCRNCFIGFCNYE